MVKKVCLIVLLLILIIHLGSIKSERVINKLKVKETTEKPELAEVLAYSRVSVMNRLMHPLSAKFPSIDSEFVSVKEVEMGRYIVSSYVECKNKSGDVVLNKNGDYEIKDLQFGKRLKIRTDIIT